MKSIIQSITDVPEEDYQKWQELARPGQAAKGEIIQQPNRICHKIYFLHSGLWRGYRLVDDQDYTHHFFQPGWFATDYQSYLTEKPGSLYLESISDSSYSVFQKTDLEKLFRQHPTYERLGRKIAERAYLYMVDRLIDFQTNSLIERYERLLANNPEIFQQVPQKYLASYFGVAAQSLSRIKSMVQRKK